MDNISSPNLPQNQNSGPTGQIPENLRGPEPPTTPTSQPELEEPKKKSGWKWVLIILIILLLGAVGTVAACELGYLNTGLEKYWGAVPSDPAEALADTAAKMENIKSLEFSVTGNTKVKINSSVNPATISQIINQSFQKLSAYPKLKNLKIATKPQVLGETTANSEIPQELASSFKISGKQASEKEGSISIEVDSSSLKSYASMLNLPENLSKATLETVILENDLYFKTNLKEIAGTDKWIHFNPKDYGLENITQESLQNNLKSDLNLDDIKDWIKSGKRQKSGMLNGEFCYHYLVDEVNIDKIQSKLETAAGTTKLSLEFWISRLDHYLRKMKINSSYKYIPYGIEASINLEINLSNFGQQIVVSEPSKTETVELDSLTSGYLKDYFPSQSTTTSSRTTNIRARDSQRKADLRSLSPALELYYDANSKYPIAVQVQNTSNTNSLIYQGLIPEYMKEMPKDPKSPQRFYGYKSTDGKSYELTCVLENTSDPDGQKVGNLYLYIVKSK